MKMSPTISPWQPPVALPPTRTGAGPRLQRKCACGGTPGPTGECESCQRKRVSLQTKLAINQPGDRYEQEADRVAAAVVGGTTSNPPAISSLGEGSALQREAPKTPPKPNNYEEAAKKIAEALAETQVGKDLKAKAAELGKDFVGSVEGKIIAGSALGGALAAIIASNSELPMQIPEVPLDFIAPGLKAKLVYEGPVQKPTSVSLQLTSKSGASVTASYSSTEAEGNKPAEQKGALSVSIPPGGSAEKKKGGPTDAEKFRAGTARMAADQAKFREGLKMPGEKKDDQSFVDSYVRSRNLDASNPLGLPPLKKKEDSLLMRKETNESSASMVAPPAVDDVLAQSGQPLDRATRSFMEARFGYDFGHVRIHNDAQAQESAGRINAHAYTVGESVVFGPGRFSPQTPEGQRLLAHELTHVVQQAAGASPSVQRQDKPAAPARVDVAIVFSDSDTAMREGQGYASTALRVTSCADAKQKLVALGKPIGTIFVVSHANSSGEIQIDSPSQTIMVKLSTCSKELSGLSQDIAPANVDFRGCKLGQATGEMEAFRQNVGAQTAQAGNCWSIVQPMQPVMISGVELTKESQIPEKQKAEVDQALRTQFNSLKSDDGRSVSNCLMGLNRGETAAGSFTKLRQRYFAHHGRLVAGWSSPALNNNWQPGSLCVKDMTATTTPCNLVTMQAAPAASTAPPKKPGGATP